MALTKVQEKAISSHRKEYGAKHATVMRQEIKKGKSISQAHRTALRKS